MLHILGLLALIVGAISGLESTNCSENCLPGPDNTTEACNGTSGDCLHGCKESFYGTTCSQQCPNNCRVPPVNDTSSNETNVCDDNGICSFGCMVGFEGPTCSCSENCFSVQNGSANATCDEETGECSSGCNQGYAGLDCIYQCSENCGLVPEPGNDTCDVTSGDCLHGCKHGYTGANCTVSCPSNCMFPTGNKTQTCDSVSMDCLHGCTAGFAGSNCSYNCSENCIVDPGPDTNTCDINSGECLLGCLYGYTGLTCMFECPTNCGISNGNNTRTCNETTRNCLSGCIQGYGGENCSFPCPDNCLLPRSNDSVTCETENGTCLLGCNPGFAGSDCSFECPANCSKTHDNINDTCDYLTGQCLHGCEPGMAGPNCTHNCPSNCWLPSGNDTETCDATTDKCLNGCKSGYAGQDCSVECPEHCFAPDNSNGIEICNATSTECRFGCNSGYSGKKCSVKCPRNCTASGMNGTEDCDSTTTECQYGCKDGYYGPTCNNSCGDAIMNCKRCSVESDTVTCDECINNFYKQNGKCLVCSFYCTPGGLSTCRESDGYCIDGCKEGRYGYRCTERCSSTCLGACHRETGHCLTGCKFPSYCGPTCQIECHDGCVSQSCNQSCTCTKGCTSKKWGEQCDKSCNTNCNETLDLTSNVCEWLTGTCTNGCKNMTYWGNDCGEDCSPNCTGGVCQRDGTCINGCSTDTVHGVGCNIPCDVNCVNGSCERADGTCFGGCKSGYFGNQCTRKCNENCEDKACDRQTGRCLFGCINGYFNDTCNQRCNVVNIVNCVDATCDRKFGNCTCLSSYEGTRCERVVETTEAPPIPQSLYFAAVGCGALVLLGLLVTIVLVTKKRRRVAKRKRADRMSKIPDEKFLGETQLRHKRKAEGVGARVTQLFIENPLARFMNKSHAGRMVTNIPLEALLKKVIQMDEVDYDNEFNEFRGGLNKSYEVSRRVDNLALNFFGDIYPYDENRVILRHSLEDEEQKSKSKKGHRKTVHFQTFFPSRKSTNYETVAKGNDENNDSNDYASVAFGMENETNNASEKPISDEDDYAKVDMNSTDKKDTHNLNEEQIDESDYAHVDMDTPVDESNPPNKGDKPFSDYASVDKDTDVSDTDIKVEVEDVNSEYAHVNKTKEAKTNSDEQQDDSDDNPYAAVQKKGSNDTVDMRAKENTKTKDAAVVIQKDYINASFIKGHNQSEKYIAAQAPAKLTATDFWMMVWEQKSHFVIMLTVIPEDGYSRCEKYWPDQGKDEVFGNFKVYNDDEEHFANYIIRTFRINVKNGIERDVVHMQFTSWPDEGCPVSAIEFIEFHQKYRSMTKKRKGGPTIVHCTAGVGRTGIFIALDILVEEGLDTLHVDVFKCVNALREQRVDMVRSLDQYEFLYKCIAQTFALECQLYDKARFQEKLADLKKFDHETGKSKLAVLYDNIKSSLSLDTAEIACLNVIQERKRKDRPKSDIPDVVFRAGLPHNVYINAVVFQSLRKSEAMVATQMPTPDTLQDFCQLLIHHDCSLIVMMNNFDPNDKTFGVYWPTGKTPVVAGKTIISQLDVDKQSDFIIRQLRVHNPEFVDNEASAHAVTMIQYKAWKDPKKVPSAKHLLKLLQLCQRFIKDEPDKRILVHCMNGAELSGLFCALVNLLELVDAKEEISVTSVVRQILARRPNAIPTLEQFEMCFAATCEYIKKNENNG